MASRAASDEAEDVLQNASLSGDGSNMKFTDSEMRLRQGRILIVTVRRRDGEPLRIKGRLTHWDSDRIYLAGDDVVAQRQSLPELPDDAQRYELHRLDTRDVVAVRFADLLAMIR